MSRFNDCDCDLGGSRHRATCNYRQTVLGCRDALIQIEKSVLVLQARAAQLHAELDRARLASLAQRLRAIL